MQNDYNIFMLVILVMSLFIILIMKCDKKLINNCLILLYKMIKSSTTSMERSILSGQIFNEFFFGMEMIKIVSEDDKQMYGFKVSDGLNILPLKQVSDTYCSGGINFCDWENFLMYLKRSYDGKYIRKVLVPDDAMIFVDDKEYTSDKLILSKRIPISELDQWNDEEFCMNAINCDCKFLIYCKCIRPELEFAMVIKNPSNIEYIKNQTEEMHEMAIEQNAYLIRHCINPSLNT